jgi:hypothetical protein
MGEKWPTKFCRHLVSSTTNEGFFYRPQICDMGPTALLPFRRKAEDFLRPGFNPRSWVPEASMLTTRPPKPLYDLGGQRLQAEVERVVPLWLTSHKWYQQGIAEVVGHHKCLNCGEGQCGKVMEQKYH